LQQLLALQERIGDVKKKGASASTITSTTQTYVYHKPAGNTSDGNENAKLRSPSFRLQGLVL
jgi:hypothetical protein